LPKKDAWTISRLDSRTLIQIKTLAHNLFHKICAEGGMAPSAGPKDGDYTSKYRRQAGLHSGWPGRGANAGFA
jgi:hypothetical protein